MNLWKHEQAVRYEQCIYGRVERLSVRFDVPPEATLRHIEKTVLKPLFRALRKVMPKQCMQKLNVVLTARSCATVFDYSTFGETGSMIRKELSKSIAPVDTYTIKAEDQCDEASMSFEITIFGAKNDEVSNGK